MDKLKPVTEADFGVERFNKRAIYILGTIIGVVIFSLLVGFSSLGQTPEYAEASQRYASPPPEPWYQGKSNLINKPVPKVVETKPELLEKPTLAPAIDPEKEAARKKAMKAGMAVQVSRVKQARTPVTGREKDRKKDAFSMLERMTDKALSRIGKEESISDINKEFLEKAASESQDNYLDKTLTPPISPFEIKAGTLIPGVLIGGINSELPGQILGQVRENVYDTVSGQHLLIPQGARLIGKYESQIAFGQNRVLIAWNRIIYPNGKSINLKGMVGVDEAGMSGLEDKVNNHYLKIFGSAVLMSIISAGAQLSQPQSTGRLSQEEDARQTLSASLGQQLGQVSTELIRKNLSIEPTLEVRSGYLFNVMVGKDLVFPSPSLG